MAAARARDAGEAWSQRPTDVHETIEVAEGLRALQAQRDAGAIDQATFEARVRTLLEHVF